MYQQKNYHNFQSMHSPSKFVVYLNNYITIKSTVPKINNSKVILSRCMVSNVRLSIVLNHSITQFYKVSLQIYSQCSRCSGNWFFTNLI